MRTLSFWQLVGQRHPVALMRNSTSYVVSGNGVRFGLYLKITMQIGLLFLQKKMV